MKTTLKTKVPWGGVSLVALMNVLITCATFGSDIAPPSPAKAWSPPGLNAYESELAHGDFSNEKNAKQIEIVPEKIYELAELIDIAERSNPTTRIAWERARQAASAVGLSQSAYFPYLVASAGAGYERAFLPFPTLKQGPGPAARDFRIHGLLYLQGKQKGHDPRRRRRADRSHHRDRSESAPLQVHLRAPRVAHSLNGDCPFSWNVCLADTGDRAARFYPGLCHRRYPKHRRVAAFTRKVGSRDSLDLGSRGVCRWPDCCPQPAFSTKASGPAPASSQTEELARAGRVHK